MTEREQALHNVRRYHFAMIDAAMFLDTHPHNGAALRYLCRMHEMHERAKKIYEQNFGSLTPAACESEQHWKWVNGPWPWERQA